MQIATVGVALAEYAFQVHGAKMHRKAVPRQTLKRRQVAVLFRDFPPRLIGMRTLLGWHKIQRRQ